MLHQKDQFQLPEDIHYLNGAYMSPLLKSVEIEGINQLQKKRNPSQILSNDFFSASDLLKQQFAQLINGIEEQIAIIPSASYGLMNAVQNIPLNKGNTAIVVEAEFPSGYNSISKWCKQHGKKLLSIAPEKNTARIGENWNDKILNSINDDTACVLISSLHWSLGTVFNLKAIGQKCKAHDCLFIVDGTQSVGALPIDVKNCHIDALVCSSYKWLLGPYAIGLAYYSSFYNDGIPIEESWLNRSTAHDFTSLTQYSDDYLKGASRYSVGGSGNFSLTPMLSSALNQILSWEVENIQAYSLQIAKPLIEFLETNGFGIEHADYRANHILGIQLPPHLEAKALIAQLQENKIFVSMRGSAIRVSIHVYNTENDIEQLIHVLNKIK